MGLGQLVRHLALIGGIERIRFTTSHPRDMDDDLINAFADTPKLMPYFHLPVQAGSDKILKAMNRQHTAEEYLAIIERLRAARPDRHLRRHDCRLPGDGQGFRSDNAAGSGRELRLCFSFKYSKRPGTPGAAMFNQVAEEVKTERLLALQALLNRSLSTARSDRPCQSCSSALVAWTASCMVAVPICRPCMSRRQLI